MQHRYRFLGRPGKGASWDISDDSEEHHIWRVLRLKPGVTVEVFDGSGLSGVGLLVGKMGRTQVEEVVLNPSESGSGIDLVLGLTKGSKFDQILPALVELAVDKVHLFKQSGGGGHYMRLSRWNKIVLESCKQAKRARLLELVEWDSLGDYIKSIGQRRCLYLDPGADNSLLSALGSAEGGEISLVVAGESGFGEQELEVLSAYPSKHLGNFVLRAGTAALAAAVLAQQAFGKNGD